MSAPAKHTRCSQCGGTAADWIEDRAPGRRPVLWSVRDIRWTSHPDASQRVLLCHFCRHYNRNPSLDPLHFSENPEQAPGSSI